MTTTQRVARKEKKQQPMCTPSSGDVATRHTLSSEADEKAVP
jgi:hypothetical protein